METLFTPKQIAKMLNISTTTLRRYEDQGLIPEVPRTASNRRCYTAIHVQAFTTIRVLLQGYPIPVVYEVMREMRDGIAERAFWGINRQQFETQAEKQRVEEVLGMLRSAEFSKYGNIHVSDSMTIGEVARMVGVNRSAIRHWEQEGLIVSERNQVNGYRVFTRTELKKIILISSLRKTVYYIDNMKQLLKELESQDFTKIERSFQLALEKLDERLKKQFHGIAELVKYAGDL